MPRSKKTRELENRGQCPPLLGTGGKELEAYMRQKNTYFFTDMRLHPPVLRDFSEKASVFSKSI